jgi:hypothetical protein
MTTPDLLSLVKRLHEALASAGPLDDAAQAELRALATDIARLEPGGGGQGVRERLAVSVERFEATHPTLAQALANVIDTLALYGL